MNKTVKEDKTVIVEPKIGEIIYQREYAVGKVTMTEKGYELEFAIAEGNSIVVVEPGIEKAKMIYAGIEASYLKGLAVLQANLIEALSKRQEELKEEAKPSS